MPKPIKKKIVKKSAPEADVSGVISNIKKVAGKEKKVFIGVASALIISIAITSGTLIYNYNLKNRAEKLEYEAYKAYYGLYQKQPAAKEEQYKKALELFRESYNLKKSPVALFYTADCYYETGKYEDAQNTLKELNMRFPDDEMYVPLSYYKMALVSLKKGSSEDALKYLDILYKYKTGAFRDLALLESGKILDAMGKTEEAKKKYEELAKNYPESPYAEEAKIKTGEKKS